MISDFGFLPFPADRLEAGGAARIGAFCTGRLRRLGLTEPAAASIRVDAPAADRAALAHHASPGPSAVPHLAGVARAELARRVYHSRPIAEADASAICEAAW